MTGSRPACALLVSRTPPFPNTTGRDGGRRPPCVRRQGRLTTRNRGREPERQDQDGPDRRNGRGDGGEPERRRLQRGQTSRIGRRPCRRCLAGGGGRRGVFISGGL